MKIVVLSRTLPESWEKPVSLSLDCIQNSAMFLSDYKGSSAYILVIECSSKEEALALEVEAGDPSVPFFEWDRCPIREQVDQLGSPLV